MTEVTSTTGEWRGLRFDIAAMSEQGPRDENQDAFSIDAFAAAGLVAVADGMGGEKSGRLAADTALRALVENGPIRSVDDARRAVRSADGRVVQAAERNPSQAGGMGCALGVLALSAAGGGPDGANWIGAHVGDVRILSRSPDGALRLETRDHTPAFARWEAGEITMDEIPDTAGANRLQRAVGRGGEADVVWLPARPGWSWLIVSDGVYKSVRLDELARAMAAPTAAEAVEFIRGKVEERGPEDNYTAVLVRALGGPAPAATVPLPQAHDPTDPMTTRPALAPAPPSRSGLGVLATLLSLAALALGGFALWTTLGLRGEAVPRSEVVRLRTEVDSLRTRVQELSEPFGPSVAPAPTPGAAPPP
jgi:PPM family protein phosphatase